MFMIFCSHVMDINSYFNLSLQFVWTMNSIFRNWICIRIKYQSCTYKSTGYINKCTFHKRGGVTHVTAVIQNTNDYLLG